MEKGNWNRAARKSGGNRPVKIPVPRLAQDDVEIMKQEAAIRAEFGEEGVKRFWERINEKRDDR